MNDFAMAYGFFMNALGMWIYSKKKLVSRANNGNTKKVVIARCLTRETLSVEQFSTNFDIKYNMLDQIIGSRE